MASIIEGLQNQIWVISKHDSLDLVWERRIPLSEASEAEIAEQLAHFVKADLTDREVRESPQLYQVDKDMKNGLRVALRAGTNPHYLASLWRADELEARDHEACP